MRAQHSKDGRCPWLAPWHSFPPCQEAEQRRRAGAGPVGSVGCGTAHPMGLVQWDRAPRPEELRGGGREHSTLQRGVGCKYFTSPVQSHEATEIRAGHRVRPEQEGIGIKALAGAWPGHHPGSAAGCCPQGGLAGLGTVCALHQPSCPGMAPPARSWGPRGAAARVPSPTQRPRVLEAVPWHGRGKGPPLAPLLPLAPTHPIPERWQLPGAQTEPVRVSGGTGGHRACGAGSCCAQRGSTATFTAAPAPN